jgi:hypothetical protein
MLEPSLLVNRNMKKGAYGSYHFGTPYNKTRWLHISDILNKAVNKCLFLKAYQVSRRTYIIRRYVLIN